MRRYASLAEYYRRHREAFELALALGITPREAAEQLDHRDALAAQREAAATPPATAPAAAPPSANPITPEQAFANFERLLGEH